MKARFDRSPHPLATAALVLALCLSLAPPAIADGGISYTDVAADPASGITYQRTPSPRLAVKDAIVANGPYETNDFFNQVRPNSPQKPWGAPGVALLDFDGDGDLDIYATNGPGTANSLYSNQLAESGVVSFVDVAVAAGVDATSQDSSGVCFGDIDNDGDPDLYVVASGDANRLFANDGDGTFTDITASAGVAGDGRYAIACTMGDIDNDGLIDIYVGNSYDDWNMRQPVFINFEYEGLEHNYLFENQGGNVFADVSASSGIENVSNMTEAAFTWAVGMADVDQDGDIDIISADNQGGPATQRSEERGWLRLFRNDGTGQFTDETELADLDQEGGWMGVAFGDLDCSGTLDIFATDLGSYVRAGADTRWFLQDASGQFAAPGVGSDLVVTPFGWGNSTFDYDNDGDTDLIYHGSVDILTFVVADNPGPVLQNKGLCSGEFTWDQAAVSGTPHVQRTVNGMATGDLDGNGFEDIVSVSNFDINPIRFFPMIFVSGAFGSPFDAVARFENQFSSRPLPGFISWLGPDLVGGSLSVELSSGNGNGWARFEAVGSAGILPGGTVNRDGIGAVLAFTPDGLPTSRQAVVAGSSYASQDSLAIGFGMGEAASGTVEILWPGGIVNRVYDVAPGEALTLPHIPCSIDGDWKNFGQYNSCVTTALNGYRNAGEISQAERQRLRASAIRAWDER